MIWRPSPSLGTAGQVFTGAFERNGYGPPRGFDWNAGSGDSPIQDDPRLTDYNVESRVNDFVNVGTKIVEILTPKVVLDQFSANKGSDIMLTLGSDFQYANAYTWYKNLDKLIEYVNADGMNATVAFQIFNSFLGRVNAFYSTPSAYVAAKQASNITWSVKTDDFFPYADCPHCYWTGYFTSRPALKRNVRVQSGYVNAAKQLDVFAGGDGKAVSQLIEEVGLAQHHDAVSGTSKQHVAYDYAQRMAVGRGVAEKMVNEVVSSFVGGSRPSFVQCSTLNETSCDFTQNTDSFIINAYNPLARARKELFKIPVSGTANFVYDSSGRPIPSQTEKSFVPFPKHSTPAPYVLYFEGTVPALGYTTFFVLLSTSQPKPEPKPFGVEDAVLENNFVKVSFDAKGQVSNVFNKKSGVSTPLTQQFMYYTGVQNSNQNSGAYIFRPNEQTPHAACTSTPTVTVVQGPVVSEVRSVCGWLAQTVRLTSSDSHIEFEFQTSEVPIKDGIGKEVITRFSTNVASNGYFYTDSNGREFQQRKVSIHFEKYFSPIFSPGSRFFFFFSPSLIHSTFSRLLR